MKSPARATPAVLLLAVSLASCGGPAHPPGTEVAPEDPAQLMLGEANAFQHDGYTILPRASFAITARVLGAEHYWLGDSADLAPVDLALGWGPMSDTGVLNHLDIRQSNRFYFWRGKKGSPLPIGRQEIIRHSANMHLIPADHLVRKQLLAIKEDQIVTLRGQLVSVRRADGWRWSSSLTREDSGAGACELVWVEAVLHDGQP